MTARIMDYSGGNHTFVIKEGGYEKRRYWLNLIHTVQNVEREGADRQLWTTMAASTLLLSKMAGMRNENIGAILSHRMTKGGASPNLT